MRNLHKKIVYWGIGNICNYCLEFYPEVCPYFFIDSKFGNKMLDNKIVKFPDEVLDWEKYYVIITIKSKKAELDIQKYLEERGLHKKEDFCTYKDYFACEDVTIDKSINLIGEYVNGHLKHVNPIMLVLPFESIRNKKVFCPFLTTYIKHRDNKCIVLSHFQVVNSKKFSREFKCAAFCVPDIKIGIQDKSNFERIEQIKSRISYKNLRWLRELEDRVYSKDFEKGINESIIIYYYYKTILELIKPSKIIIWGNWGKESYILGHIAKYYNIPHGYMEYGWIPGTYQIDPRGIAGQSEYAINPQIFEGIEIENTYDVEQIKQYIRKNKLDSRTFISTEEDRSALSQLDENRKTIFLVGMDNHGMRMNPKNSYWKKYISNVVESTEEALTLLVNICKKNKWNLIFKPHPGNLVQRIGESLDDVIIVLDAEIDKLIELSDVVVSIASTVDYKVLIYGKPLVSLGITTLLGKGCAYIVSEQKMLEEQLLMALENGMTEEQTENFNRLLQILLQRYLWDDMSERSLRYGLTVEHDFL